LVNCFSWRATLPNTSTQNATATDLFSRLNATLPATNVSIVNHPVLPRERKFVLDGALEAEDRLGQDKVKRPLRYDNTGPSTPGRTAKVRIGPGSTVLLFRSKSDDGDTSWRQRAGPKWASWNQLPTVISACEPDSFSGARS